MDPKQHILSSEDIKPFRKKLHHFPSLTLTQRQQFDLELLLNGGFSPLNGFMGKADYESVLQSSRLADGNVWPMPICLDVDAEFAEQLVSGNFISLHDSEGIVLALLEVADIWQPDKLVEVSAVYGTDNPEHPGVYFLLEKTKPYYVSGRVMGFSLPHYVDFKHLRATPAMTRDYFKQQGWQRIVGFQTRNPMHRAHQELSLRAAQKAEANLLIHPVVGLTKPGDVDHYTRVRCYEHLLSCFPEQTTLLRLLPLAMRMAGPREALWHAIIRKNYGCTHFIVGRDHAGPGKDKSGKPFYGVYDAQEMVHRFEKDIGIKMIPFQEVVYVKERAQYIPMDEIKEGETAERISGTEVRRRLRENLEIPEWFSYPDVIAELRKVFPAKSQQGFTVFFTGLSGAGKSTLAKALQIKLREQGDRKITLLDGDIVRTHLSSKLGFSKEDRDLNISRIGFVASEITKHGGVAICAPIAPYDATRRHVRELVENQGGFVEVYVSTPLDVCEERDPKGLYSKVRAGVIKHFTGIDDPYEPPADADLVIDTSNLSVDECVQEIVLKLEALGFFK